MSEEIIQKVGQYEVEEFKLQNNYGSDPLILSNFMVEMTIYEDIFSPYMHGNILIADSKDLINGLGIHGGESITIKFRTTSLEDAPENILERTFIVSGIYNRGMINDRQQTYTLKFCSPEGYDDQTKPMAGIQTVEGNFKDAIQKLYDDKISGGRDRTEDGASNDIDIQPDPEESEFAYMSNNWSPIQNMMYLTKFAKSGDGIPDYLFFESNKGYHFRSISEMIESQKESPFDQYSYVQEGQPPVTKDGESLTNDILPPKFSQFNEIDIPRTIDVLEGQASGQYASNTMMIDFFSKERQTIASDVRGDMASFKKTDSGLGVPAFVPRNSLQKTFMMYGNSILNTTNKVGFGVLDGAYVQGAGGYSYSQAFRRQYLYSFKDYSFEVIVPGRTDIEVGRLVKLVYPKGTSKAGIEDQDEALDPVLSGNYLITSIAHRFKPTDYTMNMNIVKNGLLEQAGPTKDEMNVSYDNAGGG
tara:strand:- start:50018 stop:51436 length:1419 start_codon:yes stop_codon:yes gene_type:complete